MFSLFTNKKTAEEITNNKQVSELGKVSILTLGNWGDLLETVRMSYHTFFGDNN